MKIKFTIIFSGPASRNQADDEDEWEEIRHRRDEVVRTIHEKLTAYGFNVTAIVKADALSVKLISKKKLSKNQINKIADTIVRIGDYEFSRDPIEITVT